ncbi:MAG: LacI family DNA-binding transcriptional regulator [Oscillospiraceae bacterium]|nr:LacI family DNA-binding transcriptional regulator [Oscillospiraceae bacterium]
MANLKDIAKQLGVSVSTVSRALNDSDEISGEMKEKVRLTAQDLGYALRGRGGRTTPEWNTAGIIVPEVISEYYAKIVHMSKDMLAAKGYSTVIKVTGFQAGEMVDAINCMHRIRVKCLLIVMDDEEVMSERIVRTIRRSRLPVILITSKYYPMLDFDCIHLDEYSGIVMAVQHLQERGYQHIGFIGEKMTVNRLTVFKQAMKFQNLEPDAQFICTGQERAEAGGYLRMKELLALPKPPDAVFCSYDQMAIGAIHALRESGLRIPEDMAIVGFDNISVSRYVEGGITTIANPYDDMISIAINVLTKRENNRLSSRQQIALRPKLVVRKTT